MAEEHSTDLPCLAELSLADIRKLDDTALSHCLRRVLAEVDHHHDVVAGFTSAI